MVGAGEAPLSVVEWKCHGASMWVPLWVEMVTRSTAQPSPSGMSSAVRPGKLTAICGTVSACLE